jgi:hypothetical protein
VEPLQREDAAVLGVDEIEVVLVARVGHREDAARIAGQQVFRSELHLAPLIPAKAGNPS